MSKFVRSGCYNFGIQENQVHVLESIQDFYFIYGQWLPSPSYVFVGQPKRITLIFVVTLY